jgi:hypothetical protein
LEVGNVGSSRVGTTLREVWSLWAARRPSSARFVTFCDVL